MQQQSCQGSTHQCVSNYVPILVFDPTVKGKRLGSSKDCYADEWLPFGIENILRKRTPSTLPSYNYHRKKLNPKGNGFDCCSFTTKTQHSSLLKVIFKQLYLKNSCNLLKK